MSAENTKHTIIIEGVDKITHVYKNVGDMADKTTQKILRIVGPMDDMKFSLSQLRDRMERYKAAAENSFRTDHIKKYNVLINETKRRINEIEKATGTCAEKTDKFFNTYIGKGALFGGAILSIKKALEFSRQVTDAAAQVEQFSVALQTMLGNKSDADKRMAEYMEIAAKTPFELNQVVDAGNKLQALGRYSRENLVMLGDLAAATSKPIDQVMGAYAKLASGQKGIAADMFRDLLITTKDWQEATGKGIKANGELLASTEEMLAALPKILAKKGFAGMMAAQSKTVTGQISNMKDALFGLQAAIGERLRPSVLAFVQGLTGVYDKMKKIIELPMSRKLEEERDQVNRLVIELTNANTPMERRREIYAELAKIAPDVIKNVKLEGDYTRQLADNLKEYNKQAALKILAAKKNEEYEDIITGATRYHEKAAKLADKMFDSMTSLRTQLEAKGLTDAVAELDQIMTSEADIAEKAEKTMELRKKYAKYFPTSTAMPGRVDIAAMGGFSTLDIQWFREYEKRAKAIEDKAARLKTNIDKIIGGKQSETTQTNQAVMAQLDQQVNEVTASGGVKNFYININKMVEKLDVITNTIKESPEQIRDLITKTLMEAVNDANAVAL